MKKQTGVVEKQYQSFDKHDEKYEPEIKEEPDVINDIKLVCNNKYSFSDFKNIRKYSDLSLLSKYYKLLLLYHRLNEFRSLNI